MSKIIYDVIQRFEVEKGVPRLISTNIQVIEGGEDLMSLAASLLKQMGFYDKFEEKRTSQYIGYRLKNPRKGDKRYQLVLAQRKEDLCICVPQKILEKHILEINFYNFVGNYSDIDYEMIVVCRLWVLPSQKEFFFNTLKYRNELGHMISSNKVAGTTVFNYLRTGREYIQYLADFSIDTANLANNKTYVLLHSDKLFPYTWQASINCPEVLKEFISYFGKVIMEQN